MNKKTAALYYSPGRQRLLAALLLLALTGLAGRVVYLHVFNKAFLQQQGDARSLRTVPIPAHRGVVYDRNGEPLAISTPVDSVWVNPQSFDREHPAIGKLAKLLDIPEDQIRHLAREQGRREFVYLKRHIDPDLAARVEALKISGIELQREYRRYYPAGEVTAHVLGFTDIDDHGQEGLELGFNDWLQGSVGAKRVIKDRLGRVVEEVEEIKQAEAGRDLWVSLDIRLQYLAYRELKEAVKRHQAKAGSAVILDVLTGEVLAMVNQPAFNPNNRSRMSGELYRNRAVTDVYEPGSVIKPFIVATALESGKFKPQTPIDTSPGWFKVAGNTIRDVRNYGLIDVATVLQKSSNVGASKIGLTIAPETFWDTFTALGFGNYTGSGFPGEATGLFANYGALTDLDRATLSFGYGLSMTPLQLTQAYGVLAGDGRLFPVTFTKGGTAQAAFTPVRVFTPETARQMRDMLTTVVEREGTGSRAHIIGYKVAGKTGTAKKVGSGGYSDNRYVALFAGFAPATRPRLAMLVLVDEPGVDQYYGGQVAAPVFSRVMGGALRLLDIPPDDLGPDLKKVALTERSQ